MPTRLTLLCHGSTTANRNAGFPLDEPLESQAVVQAAALKDLLRQPDRTWSSPALRARQTATALALHPVFDDALRECDYGRWAGHTLADIHQKEPESVATWLADTDAAPHGGESISAVLRRAAAWLDRHSRDGGHGLLITHATVIRAAILHAIEAPARSFWHIDIGPLCMVDLRHDGVRWTWRAIGAATARSPDRVRS